MITKLANKKEDVSLHIPNLPQPKKPSCIIDVDEDSGVEPCLDDGDSVSAFTEDEIISIADGEEDEEEDENEDEDDEIVFVEPVKPSSSSLARATIPTASYHIPVPAQSEVSNSVLGIPFNPYRAPPVPVDRRLICGIDPGISNLGFAWLDPTDGKTLLQVFDINVKNGIEYDFNRVLLSRMIDQLITSLASRFNNCSYLFVEDQVMPKGNRSVLEICVMFVEVVRLRFPHITVHRTRPQCVRWYWGISGTGGHTAGKIRSMQVFKQLLGADEYTRISKVFTKIKKRKTGDKKEIHPDAMEALLLAYYGYENLMLVRASSYPNAIPYGKSIYEMQACTTNVLRKKYIPVGANPLMQEAVLKNIIKRNNSKSKERKALDELASAVDAKAAAKRKQMKKKISSSAKGMKESSKKRLKLDS